MSIHIILGKPGSGKSMYGVYMLIKELVYGSRNCVTNLPLKLPELNEYLNKKFPAVNHRMIERTRVMTDDEMRNFWKFRGPPTEEKPNGDDKGQGVWYGLDEAHIAFNARDWATLGRDAIHYMSQHRKLGDMVVPITQAVGNLDKQFRSVAEDYTTLRNEYTAKMGPFRGAGRFVRKSYYSEPQKNAEPFEVATFQIDKAGVASCYDTAKGIGVHGNKADIGRRAKGIPIWWIFPIIIGVASMIVFLPWLLGRSAGNFIKGDTGAKLEKLGGPPTFQQQQGKEPPKAGALENFTRPMGQNFPSQPKEKEPEKVTPAEPKRPVITGYLVKGGQAQIVMDDGTIITDEDGRMAAIRRGRVLLDGNWITPTGSARGRTEWAPPIKESVATTRPATSIPVPRGTSPVQVKQDPPEKIKVIMGSKS